MDFKDIFEQLKGYLAPNFAGLLIFAYSFVIFSDKLILVLSKLIKRIVRFYLCLRKKDIQLKALQEKIKEDKLKSLESKINEVDICVKNISEEIIKMDKENRERDLKNFQKITEANHNFKNIKATLDLLLINILKK